VVKVKGTTLYGRLRYVRTYYGEPALEQVLGSLADADLAKSLRMGAIRSEWYPFPALVSLTEAIDRVCGKGDGSLIRPMAGQIAQDDLSSIYKVFFRVASTAFIVGRASAVWRQYYDAGDLVVLGDQPGKLDLEIRGFPTPHTVHCESVAGWMERCVALTGASSASVSHPECRAAGGRACLFTALWQ
jgi:hypothetical protein